MDTRINRAKKLVNLLERLVKQELLYTAEKIVEMKGQLRVVKEELAQIEGKLTKGFGKK